MTSEPSPLCRTLLAATVRHAAAAARFDHEVGVQAGLPLSTYESSFVNLLRLHGPLSPGELGKLTGLSSSGTITGVIDRLERAGYVVRERCVEDRRRVTISLNTAWLDQENNPRLRALAALMETYTAAELETIADFVTKLADLEAGILDPATGSMRDNGNDDADREAAGLHRT
ncbi:MarR family winged helix-turn-helix transcriptional regulator [Kribbella italica]|uniref:DNA-binding MarR family transcriptional regulator n=1 Tax=Kribbella italica TaxID=1540520 RepID=A0A7W9MUJ7_9ACTN|nr:MarR family transcriptional regulator [Kribbella italica]MBB5836804.1 DNA-binding MarR family transcriptional regulator [Kribbella italica]